MRSGANAATAGFIPPLEGDKAAELPGDKSGDNGAKAPRSIEGSGNWQMRRESAERRSPIVRAPVSPIKIFLCFVTLPKTL